MLQDGRQIRVQLPAAIWFLFGFHAAQENCVVQFTVGRDRLVSELSHLQGTFVSGIVFIAVSCRLIERRKIPSRVTRRWRGRLTCGRSCHAPFFQPCLHSRHYGPAIYDRPRNHRQCRSGLSDHIVKGDFARIEPGEDLVFGVGN